MDNEAGTPAATRSEVQWQQILDPDEYAVLRQGATERPYTGQYTDVFAHGTYRCRACNAALFASDTKFPAHCGWPAFFAPLARETVVYIPDKSMGMERVEVRCANCGSHLGHVFHGEGFGTPTDDRYCINSISLVLDEAPEATATATPEDEE